MRQVALWLVAAECLKHDALRAEGEILYARALAAAGRQLDSRYSVAMLYERGQEALKRGDKKVAEEHLSTILATALTRPTLRKAAVPQPAGPPPGGRPSPPPAAPRCGDAPPVASPAPGQTQSVAPITLSQFQLAMTVVHLAAEQDMPELALKGVQGALAGGLPVPDAMPAVGGRSGPQPFRAIPSQAGPGTEITTPVGRELTKVSATWRAKKYPPEQMYEALLAIVVPPSRPGEILLYEDTILRTSWNEGRSLGLELAIWAVAAKREEQLRKSIAGRRARPDALLSGDVLLLLVALEGKETAAAKAALASIAAQIKPESSAIQAMSAARVAGRALAYPGLDGDALPVLQVAFRALSKSSYYLEGGLPLLSRYYISHKRRDDLRSLHDSYLVARQSYYADYGSGGNHYQKDDLIKAAAAAAELRDLPLLLEYLGRAADIPATSGYNETSFAHPLGYFAVQVRAMSASERYSLLRDWTLPAEKRRSVRFAAAFLTAEQRPAALIPADARFKAPPGTGLVSNFSLLVEAAKEAGKLDELQAAADAAAAEKLVHAKTLQVLVALARGDKSAVGTAQAFVDDARARAKAAAQVLELASRNPRAVSRQTPAPDTTWDDLAVLQSAFQSDATRETYRPAAQTAPSPGKRRAPGRASPAAPHLARDRTLPTG